MASELITAPPMSKQVANRLEQEISDGILQPGARVYSTRHLASQYSVSVAVIVSAYNILEKKGLITREGGRGTFVKEKTAQNQNIFGIITTYVENSVEGFFEAINKTFFEYNSLPITANFQDEASFNQGYSVMTQHSPKAYFFDVEGRRCPVAQIKELAQDKPACVIHRWEWEEEPVAPAVLTDFLDIYKQGFDYFFKRNHKRIILVGHHEKPLPFLVNPYKKAAEAFGLTYPSHEIDYIPYTIFRTDPAKAKALFNSPTKPSAFFGMNDHITYELATSLKQHYPDIKPDLLGIFNTTWSKLSGREFSSFDVNFEKIWQQALKQMTGKTKQKVEWVKAKLILRNQ